MKLVILVKGETKKLNVIWTCNTFLLVTVNLAKLLFNKCFFFQTIGALPSDLSDCISGLVFIDHKQSSQW